MPFAKPPVSSPAAAPAGFAIPAAPVPVVVEEGPFIAYEHVFQNDFGNQQTVISLSDAKPNAPEKFPKYFHQKPSKREFTTKALRDAALTA